jgi:replication-associated recombination protein RarA
MDFHQKHEPKSLTGCAPTFDKAALTHYLDQDDRKQVYLMMGPTGLGKTTSAKIVGQILAGGKSVEVIERNMANDNSIENVRDIVEDFRQRTIIADVRVFILDEPQRIVPKTQDVLFKALDTLPEDIYVIFCTTDPQTLKPTLRHRCHEISFHPLSKKEQGVLLSTIIQKEGWTIGDNTDPKQQVLGRSDANKGIEFSDGSIRKLFENIHTLLTHGTLEATQEEIETENLVTALRKGTWKQVAASVMGITDYERTRQQTCYAISKMMRKTDDDESLKKYGKALGCMVGMSLDPDAQNAMMDKAYRAWTHMNGKSAWLDEG